MIDFSGLTLSFNVNELLKASMNLIMIVSPFVLLGIALMFSKEIMFFLKTLVIREQYRKDFMKNDWKTGEKKWTRRDSVSMAWNASKYKRFGRR
ncbi:MAG TPA: hypothetical protein GX497_03470 [Bacillus bacterium]|nr:hypothetical protein [Bacillus sp. (in: firmicutes)]